MKKIKFLIAVILAATCCATAISAQEPDEYSTWLIAQQPAQAQMLQELGLFQGTDKGFELDKIMTRAEAAVMLIRLLGADKEAAEKNYKSPFKDVPDWCAPYVGWLYENKMTVGTSETTYTPQDAITCKQYSMFLRRALVGKITDAYDLNLIPQVKIELADEKLTRGNAVEVSSRALAQEVSTGCETLAEALISRGVFTEEALIKASAQVYSTEQLYNGMLAEFPILLDSRQTPNEGCVVEMETLYKNCGVTFSQRKNTLYAYNKTTEKKITIGTTDRTNKVQCTFATCVGDDIYILQNNYERGVQDEKLEAMPKFVLIKYNRKSDTFEKLYEDIRQIWRYDFDENSIYMGGLGGLYEVNKETGKVIQLHNMTIMYATEQGTIPQKNVVKTPYGVLSILEDGEIALSSGQGNTRILMDFRKDVLKTYDEYFSNCFYDYYLEGYDGNILKFSRLHTRPAKGNKYHRVLPSFEYNCTSGEMVCVSVGWPANPTGLATEAEEQEPLFYANGGKANPPMTISEYLKICKRELDETLARK